MLDDELTDGLAPVTKSKEDAKKFLRKHWKGFLSYVLIAEQAEDNLGMRLIQCSDKALAQFAKQHLK